MDARKLTQKLKRGDRLALDRAMKVYTPYLSTVVWTTMGPAATAQDVEEVVSDAFLALWLHRDSLRTEAGIKSYLAAIARNKAIDRLRAAPPPPLPLDEAEIPREGPETEVAEKLFASQLWQAVETLGPPDSQLIFRFYYGGERLKDIAADLGLSAVSAKTRLHRARQKLKDTLSKGGAADGTDG